MREATAKLTSAKMAHTAPPVPVANPSTDRERLIAAAFAMRGVPYEYGAKRADAMDCSGFTKRAYQAVSVALPDGSFNQAANEKTLAYASQIVPGDLLFYRWAGSSRITHVTMYAGDGWVIGSGSPGQPKKVVVYPLSDDLRNDGRVITFRHITLNDER